MCSTKSMIMIATTVAGIEISKILNKILTIKNATNLSIALSKQSYAKRENCVH